MGDDEIKFPKLDLSDMVWNEHIFSCNKLTEINFPKDLPPPTY